jgi:hypothetical protein
MGLLDGERQNVHPADGGDNRPFQETSPTSEPDHDDRAEPSATVQGNVTFCGGPRALQRAAPGQRHAKRGTVLVFASEDRSGDVLLSADIQPDGSFSFHIAPGRYYLATTAATSSGRPFHGPLVSAVAGQRVQADIVCQLK